jgi:hypothetical protein
LLEQWEVERVMTLLHADDALLRTKVRSSPPSHLLKSPTCDAQTVGILHSIDNALIPAHLVTLLDPLSPLSDINVRATRALEVANIAAGANGTTYVGYVRQVLEALEGGVVSPPGSPRSVASVRSDSGRKGVVESAVEGVLVHVRDGAYTRYFFVVSAMDRA